MTAEALLAMKSPEDLYPGDPAEAKHVYRDLALKWHPDAKTGNHEVFAHIAALYERAIALMESGNWPGSATVTFPLKSGNSLTITYHALHPFELGKFAVGDDHVTYLVLPEHKALYEQARAAVRAFRFGSPRMRADIERCLPTKVEWFETKAGLLGMKVPKRKELILLRDVINHLGQIHPKHVAWIQNTLHNIVCYLAFNSTVHNDISPDTYFIDPEGHSGALLGGWWYSVTSGTKLALVTKRTAGLLPWSVRTTKQAQHAIDLELVKAVGRESLGKLMTAGVAESAPKVMADWLRSVSSQSPVESYGDWGRVLKEGFGPRRFVELKLVASDVYKPRAR